MAYTSQSQSTMEGGQGGNSSRGRERDHGGKTLIDLLSYITKGHSVSRGIAHSVLGPLPSIINKECPTDTPLGQSDGGSSSTVPSSQVSEFLSR